MKKPNDFCTVHDVLLKEALRVPKGPRQHLEFTVKFYVRRLKCGVLVEDLSVSRRQAHAKK